MRPSILNELFASIATLKGVGYHLAKCYEKLLSVHKFLDKQEEPSAPKIIDLIYHKPDHILYRQKYPDLMNAQNGDVITTKVRVEEHITPERRNHPYRIRCYNPTGFITIVYFKLYHDFLEKKFPIGQEVIVSGHVDRFNGELQMSHPDYILNASDNDNAIPEAESVYPLTIGLTNKIVRRHAQEAVSQLPDLPEWIDDTLMKSEGWESWKESILAIHNSNKNEDLDLNSKYVRRLAFDELFANQLAMALIRRKIKNNTQKCALNNCQNSLKAEFLAKLPFELTGDQSKVLKEIETNIYSEKRMLRLLQGDVGSGKTVVAFLSALPFVENKKQVAFMVPTSILAQQHYEWVHNLCKDSMVKVEILTGKIKGKKREQVLNDLKAGKIDVLIGTHAVFQKHVEFKDLGYVIIDEQHRFGVAQRFALAKKGNQPDVLVMTATPIPRTLTLTIYGDMEVSYIKEKPKNRKKIETKIVSKYRLPQLIDSMKAQIEKGAKMYWICPLVDESEVINASAVNKRFQEFKAIFGAQNIGFIHGRLKEEEKDSIMKEFSHPEGNIKLLVATTVVEVGIDVTDATIMIIEHPERFGLSQLHQLRGRIGRGMKESFCILLHDNPNESTAKRLKVIREMYDGFEIAEEDLKMRGAGEVLGTKQSGYKNYKIANLNVHYDLLHKASQYARTIAQKLDQNSKINETLSLLLYLFQYDSYTGLMNFC